MEDIRRRSNLMVDLLKLTSNKKILSKFIMITTNFVVKLCQKILFAFGMDFKDAFC